MDCCIESPCVVLGQPSWLRLAAMTLLLAAVGCGGREVQPPAPTPSSAAVSTGLPESRKPAIAFAPLPPSHTERTLGVFRVVQDSRPDPSFDLLRWDRVEVFRDAQRLLDVTSDELGPYVSVDEATGRDITGDGAPEIVLESQSGGNHCCEDLFVYTVTPTVSRLAHVESMNCGTKLVDLDGDGVLELVTCDDEPDIPAAKALGCSEAERPAPKVIYRFEAATGHYRLATPAYAERRREALRRAVRDAEQRSPADSCAMYAAALDVLYGGDRREAERVLQRLRPADCDGSADCAERAARFAADLRAQLWEALRRSDRYMARSNSHAPVLSR